MSYALQVFVSSTCYELRDLRAAARSWLKNLGLTPLMSEATGFPHVDGMPPYATCLRVLENCPLVVVIVDRRYGSTFSDWGPYPQFAGCSPTHAELRHALNLGKRVLVYVHDDVWTFYEVWRQNRHAFATAAPQGLEEATLNMLHELRQRNPVPWMAHFSDVAELLESLNAEFVNQLYSHLLDRERQTADLAGYMLDKILEAAPEVRERVMSGISPDLFVERNTLRTQLGTIEQELERTRGASQARILELEGEKAAAATRLETVTQRLGHTSLLLARAALKDASWLTFVRTTMMPKQPGRVPFHNTTEVALRGYHAAAGNGRKPQLENVTWSRLEYLEGGLHRGYRAGIVFRGSNFVPGITTAYRRADAGLPAGQSDYFWLLPNIYFGDYLEVSTSDDPIEGALSWRDYEFQVKNPDGTRSDWVPFSYPFDDVALECIRTDSLRKGEDSLGSGNPGEAIEPLRKAYVFADCMLGIEHPETLRAKQLYQEARDRTTLAKLRFREGARLKVTAGPHAGKSGVVEQLLLNHVHAYAIRPEEGEIFLAADNQVEATENTE